MCFPNKTQSYAYDGKAKKPAVTVKDGKTVLKSGTDYTVSYQNNKNAGKAKVIVKGKGNYQGTVTKTFTITVKLSLSDAFINPAVENSLELKVKVININSNKAREILSKCEILREYS